jgi:hypothetical protein
MKTNKKATKSRQPKSKPSRDIMNIMIFEGSKKFKDAMQSALAKEFSKDIYTR